ncbi:MAG: hypothetical protein COB83_06135 [Gammaproteobacteria bacterium]|nr:MAG: hypothetical protein COB83_06135 [Gammaproteobacteria bacterium]
MKKILTGIIFLSFLLVNFMSIKVDATTIARGDVLKKCPKNTEKNPVSLIFVVLDKNKGGLPIDAIVLPPYVKFGDMNKSKHNFTSLLKQDHEVEQETKICFRAIVKSSKTPSGYIFTEQKIALLWQPSREIYFSYIVTEDVPKNSPVGLFYKFTVATEASDPRCASTYLDPRIVIKKRL